MLILAATLVLGEVVVRMLGIRARFAQHLDIQVEPGGRMFQTDATLGYKTIPGRYRIRLHTGYAFTATNRSDTLRISEADDQPDDPAGRPEISLLGCSFTYGYSVDDEDTIPWCVQAAMPEYDIVNYGVPGYSTVQGWVQLRELLQRGKRPRLAVLLYFDDHDKRNTLLRERRQLVDRFSRLGPMTPPYARFNRAGNIELTLGDQLYRPFPWVGQSALMNASEELYNRYESRRVPSHQVTAAVIMEISKLCREHGVALAVTSFSSAGPAQPLLAYCRQNGITAGDIGFDKSSPEDLNWPADPAHASPIGYRQLADHLECFLKLQPLAEDYAKRFHEPATRCDAAVSLGKAHWKQSRRPNHGGQSDHRGQAAEYFQVAATLEPENVETQCLLAEAFRDSGDVAAAIERFRNALQLDKNSARAAHGLAQMLIASTPGGPEAQEAVELAQRACEISKNTNPEELTTLAYAFDADGKHAYAKDAAISALEMATLQRRLSLAAQIDEFLVRLAKRSFHN